MRLRVLDVDGSLLLQPQLMGAVAAGEGDLVAAADLSPHLRFLADREGLGALAGRLGAPRAGDIHFYGSGDFHHLAFLLVSRLDQPVNVVHFDNHPDWTRWPRTLGCGSWVSRLLERLEVARVVTIGPCSTDIDAPQMKAADLPALRCGRLELFPLAAGTTFYAGPAFETAAATGRAGIAPDGLSWRGIGAGDWVGEIDAIAARLPELPVWISLDKDVLAPAEAVTNWDQGRLSLDAVLRAISTIAERRRVIGMDVCGDFAPEGHDGALRGILSFLDRAQRPEPGGDAAAINGAANARILAHMEPILQ
ncbi:hypothetical protein V5F44_14990 [Xanthobacter sp. V2C-8]|uniref:hypothetical protein n=1 Tax=Xanthobacter albus TaxID=3119929 RepID=UPI00372865F9